MVYMVISHHIIVLPTNENIALGTVPNAFFFFANAFNKSQFIRMWYNESRLACLKTC